MNLKVVEGDLAALSSAFHSSATEYRGLAGDVSPPIADGGDGGLDSAIKAVAELILALHTGFGDRLDDHGDKVKYAHDSYQRGDVDVHGVFEDLMKGED
jgi:Family of unknown function (DUF6317)